MSRTASFPISRRAALAAPALLAAGHAVSQTAEVDVVIIGAGAAGLAAARTAQAEGVSFTLIEARDRIGGRTLTDRSLGVPVDGGATFIHFADRNPWTAIAAEVGVETRTGNWRSGGYREFSDGAPVEAGVASGQRSGRGGLWALMEDVDASNDVSFARLVANAPPEVVAAAQPMARGAVGEEPERVSVADYGRLYDGPNRVVPEGYGTIVERYGAGVPVRTGVFARLIDWSGRGVRVETDQGDIRARAAIVTVPIGVLKAEKVRFRPALPRETANAIDGLAMGALSKIALKFDGDRFGAAPDMHFVELRGARPGMSFEMWPFDRDVVVCWFGADYAREINRLGEEGAVRHMLERLVRIVGPEAEKAFRGGRHFGWSEDPFALGGYSYARVGHAGARDALRKPVADRLWFAGEACAGKASMTVGGAHQTGEQAARSIAARLRPR